NIRRLELSNVGALLQKKDFQESISNSSLDAWLPQFWKYWHENEDPSKESFKDTFGSASGVSHYPILQANCGDAKTYLKPSDLDILPIILEPVDVSQQKICSKMAGLYKANSNYVPRYLRETEASL